MTFKQTVSIEEIDEGLLQSEEKCTEHNPWSLIQSLWDPSLLTLQEESFLQCVKL